MMRRVPGASSDVPRAILWFRLNLRLHDNAALESALSLGPDAKIFPIFTIDPHFVATARVGIRRWQFLLESLADLGAGLRSRGSRLIVLRGDPMALLPVLFKDWRITHLIMMSENQGGWSRMRDERITQLANDMKVDVRITQGHNLYAPSDIWAANKGKPCLTYQSFLGVVNKLAPVASSKHAPAGPLPKIEDAEIKITAPVENGISDDNVNIRDAMDTEKRKKMFDAVGGPNGTFDIPTLEEFGFTLLPPSEQSPHRGGETEALRILDKYIAQKKKVAMFEKPKTSPAAFNPADTTVLSPHLKFGTLSIRLFHERILAVYKEFKSHSQPPVSLLGQILWRDFYYQVALATPGYAKMQQNSICMQIDWWCRDGPEDPVNATATRNLRAWSNGETGFPWIDAIMNQLRREGWIHHLARHSVACFLTRGDLFISWERGAEVFEELLLDHDPALNIGNWLWLSASAFFHQYFRVYSPVSFGKKYDQSGKFIRKYVPVLKDLPAEFIYEPWKAPKKLLEKHGIELGKNYPHPIVNHEDIHKVNIGRMKLAYQAAKKGGKGEEIPVTLHAAAGEASDDEEKGDGEEEERPRKRGQPAPLRPENKRSKK